MRHGNMDTGGLGREGFGESIPNVRVPRAATAPGRIGIVDRRIGALAVCALSVGLASIGTATTNPVLAAEGNLIMQAREAFEAIPIVPPNLKNDAATNAKIELGNMLFHDPRLSSSWKVSCASCHSVSTGGVDQGNTSVGHGWYIGPRNAPTVLNAVFNIDQFWDGRAEDLVAQAKGPPENPGEMNSTRGRIEETLKSMPEYVRRFQAAFPNQANPVSYHNMAPAIATFETTLTTPNARFDQFLRTGRSRTLAPRERDGLELFIRVGCAGCHGGVNVGGGGYAKFGLVEEPDEDVRPPDDTGRAAVTGNVADKYVFKIPTLRNIALTAPYFHTGSVWDLRQAIAIMAEVQLGAELSGDEIDAIAAFLNALTGDQPQIRTPTLPAPGMDTPHPEFAVDYDPTSVSFTTTSDEPPGSGRVTFPAGYASDFAHFMTSERWDNNQVRELFANEVALEAAAEGGELPDGAVLAMEVYGAKVDDEDEPILDADGRMIAEGLKLVAVMEKGAGWGDAYPDHLRNGDWEYAFFTPEGTLMADTDTDACRECHLPYAEDDFVIHREQLNEVAED